jgi:hypothetical protein
MNTRRSTLAAALVCMVLGLGACQSNKTESGDGAMAVKADNTVCPLTQNAVNESAGTVSHNGKNIGFCCGGCKSSFQKMSSAERDAALAKINM